MTDFHPGLAEHFADSPTTAPALEPIPPETLRERIAALPLAGEHCADAI